MAHDRSTTDCVLFCRDTPPAEGARATVSGQSSTSYDEVPYINRSFPQTHPDRLATLATLFGVATADIDRARVLELGSASGDNLIPMALALPGSQFLGIDL